MKTSKKNQEEQRGNAKRELVPGIQMERKEEGRLGRKKERKNNSEKKDENPERGEKR